ncbi:DUF3577 domain-containing protein [Pseudomonas aeruginosa]|uniref:DUF3577 domain-containing protein n=1 Tax=Pseudomonas aeruginosa TaxID=287 RepID=UPI00378C3FE5
MHQKGEKQGKPDASLKGQMIFISWIKVDGTTIVRCEGREGKSPARPRRTAR